MSAVDHRCGTAGSLLNFNFRNVDTSRVGDAQCTSNNSNNSDNGSNSVSMGIDISFARKFLFFFSFVLFLLSIEMNENDALMFIIKFTRIGGILARFR